jgi:hypothetical protein
MVTGNVIAEIFQRLRELRDTIQFLTGNTNRALVLANQALTEIADLPTTGGPFEVVSELLDQAYNFAVQFPGAVSSDVIFVRLTILTGAAPVSFNPATDFISIEAGESAAAKYTAPGAFHCEPISIVCGVPEVAGTYLTSDVYVGFAVIKMPQLVYTNNGFGDGGSFATAESVTMGTEYFNIRHCRYS